MPKVIALEGTLKNVDGSTLNITLPELFKVIANGYNYATALQHTLPKNPRIAMTVMAGSQKGGGTIQLYRYANWLTDLGYRVTIYSNDQCSSPTWTNLKCHYRVIADDYARYAAITEDIVLVYSVLELPQVLQNIKSPAQRVLHICQGLEEFHFGNSYEQHMAPKPFFSFLTSLPVGRIVASSALQNYFHAEYQQESYFIQNSIDEIFFGKLQQDKEREPSIIKILQVANPGQYLKGTDITLRAASLIGLRSKSTNTDVRVTFVSGPSPCDSLMRIQIPSNVSYEIKSGLSPEQLLAEYQRADVVVNGSFHEGFGLTSIEAMAAGTPVIQVDNFGLNDIVIDRKHAVVVPRNNASEMASAIVSVMSDEESRKRMVLNARVFSQSYTIKEQAKSFITTWSKILSQSLPLEKLSLSSSHNAGAPVVEISEPAQFSVLVPIYNHASFLPTTLNTLRAQSYPHWEAILVNDGSTDECPEIMRQYSVTDSRFKVVHRENGGTAAALNTALEHATNDWICWLSSDDFFKPNKLELHARYSKALPHIKFFHSHFSTFDEVTQKEEYAPPVSHKLNVHPAFQTITFMVWNYVHGNTIAIKKELFDQVGKFNPLYPNAQDFDMWLRMSNKTPFFFMNHVTCTTRMHSGSGTSQFPQAGIFDSYRSAMAFINQHNFNELTPFVKKHNAAEFLGLFIESLNVASEKFAFLYQGITHGRSPFLDRLYEWTSTYAEKSPQLKTQLIALAAGKIAELLNDQSFPRDLLAHFRKFIEESTENFIYKPVDPIKEYLGTYEYGLKTPHPIAVDMMQRYFTKLSRHGIPVPHLEGSSAPLAS